MNEKLIPKVGSDDVKENYNIEKWKTYARRMTKNEFMKMYILKKYNGICQWCRCKIINKFVIHHIDYERECINTKLIEIAHPTEKRPNRVYKVPDCENCYKNNPLEFYECVKRIVPVHSGCNQAIEKARVKRQL